MGRYVANNVNRWTFIIGIREKLTCTYVIDASFFTESIKLRSFTCCVCSKLFFG